MVNHKGTSRISNAWFSIEGYISLPARKPNSSVRVKHLLLPYIILVTQCKSHNIGIKWWIIVYRFKPE